MPKEPPLTRRKSNWLGKRDATIRGTGLRYNAAQQSKYAHALRKLVREMTSDVNKQITKLFNSETADKYFSHQEAVASMDASLGSQARILMNFLTDKFIQLFSDRSKSLAEYMLKGAAAASKSNLHASLKQLTGGLSLKTGVVPKGMETVSKATIAENVSLIQSIPEQYLKDVTGAVMRSITTGNGLQDLIPAIKKYEGQTERRAKNIALDQTRKAYNSINKQRLVAIGVKQFEWVHSGGGQVPRHSHLKILNGKIFSFDNLEAEQAALGVPPQDRGIPGYPINCRCTILPVSRFLNASEND